MFSDEDRRIMELVGDGDRVVETAAAFDVTRMDAELVGASAQRKSFKPKGFWYGIGPGWLEFTIGEGGSIRNLYALRRGPVAVLRVEGPGDVAAMRAAGFMVQAPGEDYDLVDWAAVAEKYGGFELAWYDRVWNERHGELWLSTYDAPSGCAWSRGVVTGAFAVG